jgi:hypothetical protein
MALVAKKTTLTNITNLLHIPQVPDLNISPETDCPD